MLLEAVQYSIRKSSPATRVSHCAVRKNHCCLFTELFSYVRLVIWQSHTWSAFMSLQNLNNTLVSARERGRRRMSVPNKRLELALGLFRPLGVFTSERKQLPSKFGDDKLRHRVIHRGKLYSQIPRSGPLTKKEVTCNDSWALGDRSLQFCVWFSFCVPK